MRTRTYPWMVAVAACAALGSRVAPTWADNANANASTSTSASAALELELPEINGTQMLRLSNYAGQSVVLNFWSSDCPPCVAEMPLLEQVSARHPEVQFLGIAVDGRIKARQFLLTQHVNYPQAVAPLQSEGILRRFGNRTGALPFTVVLDLAHRLCQSKTGGVDAEWLNHAVRRCTEPPETERHA